MLARSTLAFIIAALAVFTAPTPSIAAESSCPAIIDHKFSNLMDEPVSLCQFSDKVLLIVNTASECGYTPQYDGLEKLYRRYREKGFAVLGFPANDFGGQEPGSNQEIAQFCRVNYGITFPVFAKTAVVGKNANPLFRELAAKTGQPPRGIFINTCSTGRDSLLPHSKAPSSLRIAGLLHRSRNCSRRGNPKKFSYGNDYLLASLRRIMN